MDIKRMTRIAMMVCIMAVCSWITIPSAVPFTMQTFAVFCAVLFLDGKDGLITVAVYILLGCIGAPVFAGFKGGVGVILGPTGGYILGFLFTALTYLAADPVIRRYKKAEIPVMIVGLFLCYGIGTLWFYTVMGMRGNAYSFWTVLTVCVLPYIVPDLAKMFLAKWVCRKIKKNAI